NFFMDVSIQSNKYSKVIKSAFDAGKNASEYASKDKLADEMKLVAKLISGGLKTKMYLVSLDGFDTHANQGSSQGKHAELLASVSKAVGSFMADMKAQNLSKNIIGLTVTEFGRRPEENASFGTDHGAAGTLFMFGDKVNGKAFGKAPNFNALNTNKDLVYQYDYRSVYDEILSQWFGVSDADVKNILKSRFAKIEEGLLAQKKILSTPNELATKIYPNPSLDGKVSIEFNLKQAETVTISIFDLGGRMHSSKSNEFNRGLNTIQATLPNKAGNYLVKLVSKSTNATLQTVRM
ncbi:MAG: DUF1501 domain-containing protein, partial [Leadbetterella sp.]